MTAFNPVRCGSSTADFRFTLALAGLRNRHPQAGEAEIRRRLMDLLLGEELAAKVYGPPDYGDPKRTAS